MSRDPQIRLEDISEASLAIESQGVGFDSQSCVDDRKTVDAVTRNLEIIGEAVKHLPLEITERHPDIPWKAIAGFRDILAHSYFRVEDSIIWDAATHHNRALLATVRNILSTEP